MELNQFFKLIKKKKRTIWSWLFVFLVLGSVITFTQPLKYGAKSKLLVIQQTREVDPYTVSKSNEYLGGLFSQIIYSSSFYDLVTASPYNIDQSYFGGNAVRQKKVWQKTVSAKTEGNTGIIDITVYHPDPNQAKQIALAVNDVLINKNFNYQGMGDSVRINIIDQPLLSNYPINPNPVANMIVTIVLGLSFSLVYIYFLPEEHYDFHLFSRSQKRHRKVKHNQQPQIIYQYAVSPEQAGVSHKTATSEPDFLSGNFIDYPETISNEPLKGSISNVLPNRS